MINRRVALSDGTGDAGDGAGVAMVNDPALGAFVQRAGRVEDAAQPPAPFSWLPDAVWPVFRAAPEVGAEAAAAADTGLPAPEVAAATGVDSPLMRRARALLGRELTPEEVWNVNNTKGWDPWLLSYLKTKPRMTADDVSSPPEGTPLTLGAAPEIAAEGVSAGAVAAGDVGSLRDATAATVVESPAVSWSRVAVGVLVVAGAGVALYYVFRSRR